MDKLEIVSEKLGIPLDVLKKQLGRGIRQMVYRGLEYLVFRREIHGVREGTTVLLGGEPFIIHGYPSIRRLAILEAVPQHMIDRIIVEEKMDGYNVRVVFYEGEVYAVTRGGYICPYTVARIRKLYGDQVRLMAKEYPDTVLAGEVVGTENPYVVYNYPEAGGFDYFIFDTLRGGKLQPLKVRDEIVEKYGFRRVRILGELDKNDVGGLRSIIDRLDKERREGIVIKDPDHRVPPLKYTTVYINIHDIEEGMKHPFDEGRGYLFSRIVRLIAQGYEYGWSNDQLDIIAKRLGKAILKPAIESLKQRSNGRLIAASYTLVFPDYRSFEEYLEYMESQGIDAITRIIEEKPNGELVVELLKVKDTHDVYGKILKTGLSPLD